VRRCVIFLIRKYYIRIVYCFHLGFLPESFRNTCFFIEAKRAIITHTIPQVLNFLLVGNKLIFSNFVFSGLNLMCRHRVSFEVSDVPRSKCQPEPFTLLLFNTVGERPLQSTISKQNLSQSYLASNVTSCWVNTNLTHSEPVASYCESNAAI